MRNWDGAMRGDQDLTIPVSRAVCIRLQAPSGIHLCLVYLKYILILPLQAMQSDNFSYFFSLPSCIGNWFYFWVFILFALSWFSLALCLFLLSSQDQTTHNLQQFSRSVVPDCGPTSCFILYIFSFTMEYPVTSRNRRKRPGWDRVFPFLQSFLSVLPVCFFFSPLGTYSVGLKTSGVYSWKFYFGSRQTSCFEKLSV